MNNAIARLLEEKRVFTANTDFLKQARVKDRQLFIRAQQDVTDYWQQEAQQLHWFDRWTQVLDWCPPHARWFIDGTTNISYNCLDRHIPERAHKIAFYRQDEAGNTEQYTYQDMYEHVQTCANVLKALGVKKGDRVALYMPMKVQAIIAMQACARIGAIHTVVFSGFSPQALADRIEDAQCTVVVTSDYAQRKGKTHALKEKVNQAISEGSPVKRVLVFSQGTYDAPMLPDRDVYYDHIAQTVSSDCPATAMDAEDPLFILYTSGTTGKPKGIVHTVGGYMVGAYTTTKYVFDIKDDDIFWCTADVGWITGHTYVAYGPMLNGATQVIYDGAPDYPHKGIFWQVIEQYGVSILYTAPTAIRLFAKWGVHILEQYDLQSLRLLGSVGEPLNPEAWMWYYNYVGQKNCPIVDTWWQTETGSIMITALSAIDNQKPGYVGKPLPGIEVELVNECGVLIKQGSGLLTITQPWPSMMRTLWDNDERYKTTYFRSGYARYYSGDAATKDEDGHIMIMGRVDDVINISGHRIGTMEIESALVDHRAVAEVAVVPKPHEIKGEAIVAFVILHEQAEPSPDLKDELKRHVDKIIGAIARPEKIIFTPDVPKTRSGKIMRRLLKEMVHDVPLSDMTTLANEEIIGALKNHYQTEV